MIQALQEAGWPAYVTIAVAVLALGLALTAAVASFAKAERNVAVALSAAALLVAVATAGIGALGYALMMRNAYDAVAFVDPEVRATLLAQAISESMNNVVIGVVCGAPSFLLALAALIVAAFRPARGTSVRGD